MPFQNCQGFLMKVVFFSGVFPKRQGGRIPVCDCSKSFAQHQTPRTDSLYAQVSIELPCAHALWFLLQTYTGCPKKNVT